MIKVQSLLITEGIDYDSLTDEEKDDHKGALGHVLGVSDYHPKATFTYYFGSGWSKADMPSMDAWTKYLKDFVVKANHPLTVNVK